MKDLKFIGTSQSDLAEFPIDAKRAAGFELWHKTTPKTTMADIDLAAKRYKLIER